MDSTETGSQPPLLFGSIEQAMGMDGIAEVD